MIYDFFCEITDYNYFENLRHSWWNKLVQTKLNQWSFELKQRRWKWKTSLERWWISASSMVDLLLSSSFRHWVQEQSRLTISNTLHSFRIASTFSIQSGRSLWSTWEIIATRHLWTKDWNSVLHKLWWNWCYQIAGLEVLSFTSSLSFFQIFAEQNPSGCFLIQMTQ